MNNYISYILTMTLGIFLTFTAAPAAERVKVFDLAESGILIEFPVIITPAVQGFQDKEIATENANSGDGLIKVR